MSSPDMSFNSVYAHNNNNLPATSLYSRQAATTYAPSLNSNTSHTTPTSPYYHQIQPPPLTVLDHQSHNMSQKTLPTSTQWHDNRINMFNPTTSPFTPYQSSNGQLHNIVGMDDKKPIYPQHNMPTHQNSSLLPPPSGHSGVDMPNPASMVGNRNPPRQLTNSKRAAQNRAAQRAFRQRKDRYIKDLEAKAKELDTTKKLVETLKKDKDEMAAIIRNLKTENAKLRGEEVIDDDGRHNGNNSGAGGSSNYSHYNNSSRNDDDSQGLGDEPWLRQNKDSVRKDALNRSGSGLTDNPPRGSGIVLPPGPNTDSSVDPYFRPEYRHANSNSPSPPSSASSDRNRNSYTPQTTSVRTEYSSNEEDTDRVYDDLCELLKTRSRPTALPQNIGRRVS